MTAVHATLPPFLRNLEERQQEKLKTSVVKALRLRVPQTPDELWHAIGFRFGRWYARRPVCAEHETPFAFIAAAYFEEADRLFGMAAKGTGKTQGFADIHELNGETRPGTWTAHVGSIEKQAKRCGDYLFEQLEKEKLIGKEVELVLRDIAIEGQPMRSMVKWRNGSRLEILAGTLGQVSGPHPNVGAMDEFELGSWEVWEHFCLTPWAKVVTQAGPRRLGAIVASKLVGPVRSYDFERGQWVWQPVTGWYCNGEAQDWYQVRLRFGQQGESDLTATGCHEVMRADGRRVRVEHLSPGEEIAVISRAFSGEQEQVLIGTLLGDGSVSKAGFLTITHAEGQQAYLRWKAAQFAEFGGHESMVTRTTASCWRTRSARLWHELRARWYPEGRKRVPVDVWCRLDWLGLAVWLMDDGGYDGAHGAGRWVLTATALTDAERANASLALARLGLSGKWFGRGRWTPDRPSAARLREKLRPWIDVSSQQAHGWKRWVGDVAVTPSRQVIAPAEIASVTPVTRRRPTAQLDIEVGGTHNFLLASGVLVGNSKNLHTGDRKRAQMILGSTRFRAKGPVERLLEEKRDVFKVVTWCVYDAMARCDLDCNHVPGFGRCPLWSRQEVQPDGSVDEVPMCAGRAHFATGHLTFEETLSAYLLSDHDSWATIMELRKPSSRGLYFPEFDDRLEGRHVKAEYEYVAGRPVYLGYDEGFNFPLVLGAWQMRDDGVLYEFDVIYRTQTLVGDVIEELDDRPWVEDAELGWPDPSARAGIEEFRRYFMARLGKPVMVWNTDNDRLNGWKVMRRRLWGWDGRATIGWHPRCARSYKDIRGLVKKEGTEDCDKVDDHGADEARYVVFNLERYLGIQDRLNNEGRRPQGSIEREEKARAMRVEGQIKERWERLLALGITLHSLRVTERQFGARRDDLNAALGGWIRENTLAGRLERAGLRGGRSREAEIEEANRPR
jgi:hypothetical protein